MTVLLPTLDPGAPPFVAPGCQACGACCHAGGHPFVQLFGADHARLAPAEQDALVEFRGNECHLRTVAASLADGRVVRRCLALGRAGGRPDGQWSCTIYERRPQVCRDYARGGPACHHDVLDRAALLARGTT